MSEGQNCKLYLVSLYVQTVWLYNHCEDQTESAFSDFGMYLKMEVNFVPAETNIASFQDTVENVISKTSHNKFH